MSEHTPDQQAGGERLEVGKVVAWETLRISLWRPVQLAASGQGLLLVVAINLFAQDKGIWQSVVKGMVSGSIQTGFLLTPFLIPLYCKLAWPVNRIIAFQTALSGIALLVLSVVSEQWMFLASTMIAIAAGSSIMPMVTALWRQRIPDTIRGRAWSLAGLISLTFGTLISLGIAWWMGDDATRYRPVVALLGFGLLLASLLALRVQSQPLERKRHPLRFLHVLVENPLFAYICLAWMFMGIANLASIPLRAQYLDEQNYSVRDVLLITSVIPPVMQILTTFIWGTLFDRINFLVVRIAITMTFAISIALFFFPYLPLQIISNALLGVAMGGGMVAWAMWVTKYSPPEQTADYMTVHVFLTGLRGSFSPIITLVIYDNFDVPIHTIAFVCVGLSLLSVAMLVPVLKTGRVVPAD